MHLSAITAALLLLAASCSKQENGTPSGDGYGRIRLHGTADVSIATRAEIDVTTLGVTVPQPSELALTIHSDDPEVNSVWENADGIQTLLLGITSDNAAFRTEIIEAAGLTDVDLCGTISRLHPFYGLQVTAGATEATIDLESIMYLFFGYEGSHTLTFNMTDNKGRNAVATLQFNYGKGTAEEDPSIVCRQFDIDQPHTTQTGDEIDVDIKTASGIQAFVVSIISETLNEEVLAAVGLRPTFDLCNITDPEELAALTSDDIGFPVNDDVKGQTSMTFSVTKFTGMLSAFPGTHQFKLAVTNAEGSTTTKTLQLIVEQ